jgi:hypothetical protein
MLSVKRRTGVLRDDECQMELYQGECQELNFTHDRAIQGKSRCDRQIDRFSVQHLGGRPGYQLFRDDSYWQADCRENILAESPEKRHRKEQHCYLVLLRKKSG